jgi:hypothetical protein
MTMLHQPKTARSRHPVAEQLTAGSVPVTTPKCKQERMFRSSSELVATGGFNWQILASIATTGERARAQKCPVSLG